MAKAKTASQDYQALHRALDDVLARLQSPDIHVDEAIALYAKGQEILRHLEAHLLSAENELKHLNLHAKGLSP